MSDTLFTDSQAARVSARLARDVEAFLRERTVETHYTAEQAAELLGGCTVRTVWNHVKAWQTSDGREGIGPVVKVSHKSVLIPASAINRWLASRTVANGRTRDAAAGKERAA